MKRTPEQRARQDRARMIACWATCIAQKRRLEAAAGSVLLLGERSDKANARLRIAASRYTAAAAVLLARLAATGAPVLPVPGEPTEKGLRALLDAVGVTADGLEDVLGDLFLAASDADPSSLAQRSTCQAALWHVEDARRDVKQAEAVRHA